jgi:hypothetical protein
MPQNEHFLPRNNGNRSESIPRNFCGTKFRSQPYQWCTLSCKELRREFSKKIEMALLGYSGAWGKLIMKKKPEVENLVTLSI